MSLRESVHSNSLQVVARSSSEVPGERKRCADSDEVGCSYVSESI